MSAPESVALELSRRLRTAQAEKRLPSVGAAVFRGRDLVWQDALGLADIDPEREATPETQYRIGSITKTVTAAAIMALRDEGALELDDPVERHLPGGAHGTPTLRRMLSHLSGLQREFPDGMWESMVDPPREQLLESIVDAEQVLEPAGHWHYSNLAYALLGEVVARASGMPWERFVEERFFRPLGMQRTTLLAAEPAARGYFVAPYHDGVQLENDIVLGRSAPAGQLWSTTGDLVRWGSFLADPDESVLAPAAVEQMHAVQAMADPERWTRAWGLGLELVRRGDRVFAGHGGAMPGFLAYLLYSRATRTGAAVVANTSVWPRIAEFALEVAEKVAETLPADRELWRGGVPAPDEIVPLLGRWWSEGSEFVLSWRRGALEARLVDAPEWLGRSVFAPEEPDRFRVVSGRERGELLRVVRDDRGEPVRLYWATYPCSRTPEVFGA